MTTSFETSLRMKELNFPQEGGEYYWVITEGETYCYHHSDSMCNTSNGYSKICRAFTLGELVRMSNFPIVLKQISSDKFQIEDYYREKHAIGFTPEEACAELAMELVKSGVIKFN